MATTNASNPTPVDRSGDGRATTNRWTEIWSPPAVSRVAGICALAYVAIAFLALNDNLHSAMSARQVVTWASQNQQAIWTGGYMRGVSNTVLALLLVLLASLSMDSRLLAGVARVGAAAGLAAGWVGAGVQYALADLAHRGGADAGVLALFSLAKTMDYTDGVSFALAIGSVSVMLLRSRTLPRPVAWLGLLMTAELIVAFPVQIAAVGTGNGLQGPINVVLAFLWALVTGIILLVRPVRLEAVSSGSAQATA